MKDWAQKLIEEIDSLGIDGDMATDEFKATYKNGDSLEAWHAYAGKAVRVENFSNGQYVLLVFEDDSCYADWNQGVDRFYSSINDLMEEDEEVRDRLETQNG